MAVQKTQPNISQPDLSPNVRQQIDAYLRNFYGQAKMQRAVSWNLKGAGSNSASFLSSVTALASSVLPATNNTYALGSASFKWSDIRTVLINGVTPRSGSVTVFVAASSGGAVTTSLTFTNGILT